ncbi:GDSL-type esterase/lipase family protein [Planctomycetota bacterium]
MQSVGDSITYGYGLSNRVTDCYPAQLAGILQSYDSEWETQNFGANGATLLRNGDQPYIRKGVYNPALVSEPDVVIIMLGTNDSWPSNWTHKEDFIPDYLALIDAFAELPSHPKIFICYPPPIFGRPWNLDNIAVRDEIIPLIDQLPTYKEVQLIDLYTPLEDSRHLLPDGCHPNTEGARVMAEVIAETILGQWFPDFNDDKIVDIEDLIMLIEHWGQDEPSVDIVIDGIIDVQDLEVLMSYWQQEIFPLELIGYWKLDEVEGDIAYNSIGDTHGILSGNPTWQPDSGQVAGALEFDGVNDYVETDFVLNPTDGVFSAFAWIKGGAPGQVIISQANSIGTGETWLGMDALGGNLMTGLRPPDTRSPTSPMVSDFVITDGQWHHVGIVVTAHGVRNLYADGMRVAADTQGVNLPSSNGGLYFGTGKILDAATFFSGLIDDVRIYDVALTAEEIEALAQ